MKDNLKSKQLLGIVHLMLKGSFPADHALLLVNAVKFLEGLAEEFKDESEEEVKDEEAKPE